MKKFFVLLAAAVFLTSAAFASYITLKTTVTAKVEGETLKVLVKIINQGDEPAYNVQAEIRAQGKKVLARKMPEVAINGKYEVYEEFKVDLSKPGEYPLVIVMHYADANQYPFSALTCQTFNYQTKSLPAEIFGKMRSKKFWKKGKVSLTLKNLSEKSLALKTSLVGPRELNFPAAKKVNISGKGTSKIDFELENFSALSGSTYQVFALSEYDNDGVHQTTITPGTVRIVQEKSFAGLKYSHLIILLGIMIVLFVLFQMRSPHPSNTK